MTLQVFLERNGESIPVGRIDGRDSSDAAFRYQSAYLSAQNSTPLSVSLPLREEAFTPAQTKSYFDGLLPEGFTRRSLAERLHVDVNDYCGMLAVVGQECIGAIRVAPSPAQATTESYEKLHKNRLRSLALRDASLPAEYMKETRLSLAGASGKTGLYFDASHDKWYLPKGTAPSTHIVKQHHVRFRGIVTNEQLCMRTAAHLGLYVADSFILEPVANDAEYALFATKRFDRIIPADAKKVSGLPRPLRLHQEDMAQALGIPAEKKYEPEGSAYLQKMFELLRLQSADPIEDQKRLWEMVVFQCLIGNADAHLKNYALLYDGNLQSKRLAPLYDVVSTVIYKESTRKASMRIGDRTDLRAVNRQSLLLAAKEAHIGRGIAEEVIDRLTARFGDALANAAGELLRAGFADAKRMAGTIREKMR